MFRVDNFISFHDLSPDARFLWASSSITHCLGYEPDEVVGMNAYEVIHKDDIPYVKITHQESVMNEMVGTQLLLRVKCKDGSYVPCMVIFSLCYDYIVSCYTVIEQEDGPIRKVSAHSTAMTSLVGSKKEEFERIYRHHRAFARNTWNPDSLDPEPRACMLLNRFSRNIGVMYASPSCELIFQVEPDLIIGKPFLLFIRADDLCSFVEQVDIAKSSTVVTHMRFYFQSPNCPQEIPCEAMLFGAADGMIVILRRCKPFIRKQLITAGAASSPSSDYFAGASSTSSSYRSSCQTNPSHNNSWVQSCSNSFNDSHNNSHSPGGSNTGLNSRGVHDRYQQHLHPRNTHGISAPNPSTFPGSPGSVSSSYSSSMSGASDRPGNRSYRAQLRGVAIGSINSIRNLDQEQAQQRPLTSLHENEDDIVDSNTYLPALYRLREHHAQEVGVDDSELEEGLEQLDLDDADDDYEDFDHDYQHDDAHGMEDLIELDMELTGKRSWERSGGGRGEEKMEGDHNVFKR